MAKRNGRTTTPQKSTPAKKRSSTPAKHHLPPSSTKKPKQTLDNFFPKRPKIDLPTLPDDQMELEAGLPSLGAGWTVHLVARKTADNAASATNGGSKSPGGGRRVDKYFYSPDGQKFRSVVEVQRFLNGGAAAAAVGDGAMTTPSKRSTPRKSTKSPASSAKKAAATAAPSAKRSILAAEPARKKGRARSPAKASGGHGKSKPAEEATPKFSAGIRVSKMFVDEATGKLRPFKGMVGQYDAKSGRYKVVYEDGDLEELSEGEIENILYMDDNNRDESSGKKKNKRPPVVENESEEEDEKEEEAETPQPIKRNAAATKDSLKKNKKNVHEILMSRTPRRSAKKQMNYNLDSASDDEESYSSEEEVKSKTKKSKRVTTAKTAAKSKRTGRKKKNADDDDESDDFHPDSESDDDAMVADEPESEEDFSPPATKGRKKSGAAAKKSSEAAEPKKKEGKKMYESFKPMSNPIYMDMSLDEIQKTKSFLDPCGMEATDDIIDRLVGQQLEKIGNLLHRALRPPESSGSKGTSVGGSLGSQTNPLVLGTACSGTDAPALALTIVQEQLERRGMGHLFKHDHVFSCEVEPYKQAYLARNFDSKLYPDISKLCDDPPRDVYGQEQPLPEFNLFVAGTSCKNFSMLMSNKRIDIEDKGCSGETFLAACELLFKEKPKYAIFENVIGAPWEKMSEYITGRVKLSSCDSNKSISKGTKGKEGELEFLFENNKIVVHKVPSVFGVRCGAVVDGYCKGSSTKVIAVKWPGKSKKNCTLTELMKHNGISKKDDTLVFENEVMYCTHYSKVDTKQYGLPQTRLRTYMFVWRPDDDNFDDDLGQYWEAILKYLESPVRHSLESFILEVDHDIIRVFREALNGPAGRHTHRGVNQAPDFWNKENANANLPHNMTARERLGLDEFARPQTKWGPFGEMHIPPHWWLEYLKCQGQRSVDLLEILHGSAARDAESHDSNFASFFWNISQNASKEKHRSAVSGIAGCITPGGDVFLPHAGRPLLGCEKLLLQGIPYFRLLLGNETEVQLGDLAGNAMSLTVVCATMLAAMTCKQLRKDHQASSNKDIHATLNSVTADHPFYKAKGAELDGQIKQFDGEVTDTKPLFLKLSELAESAIKSSIWCTCETSGRISHSSDFLRCAVCSVASCRDCCHGKQGYQLDSHDIKDVHLTSDEHDSNSFEMTLRSLMPPSLHMDKEGLDKMASLCDDKYRVDGLSDYVFVLHRIKRHRMKWIAVYYARDGVIGEAVAEFKIIIGEVESRSETADRVIGVQGELKSFFPARKEPLQFGNIEPCAIARQCTGDLNMKWAMRAPESTTCLKVVGHGSTDSFRVQVGLTKDADAELKENASAKIKAKKFGAANARGEERRWIYAKNWMEWPEEIMVTDSRDPSEGVLLGGKYVRAGCKQTFNQSACWIRKNNGVDPELYLLLKPQVARTGPDYGIISTSTNHDDVSSVLAFLPRDWQPCDALIREKQDIQKVVISNWAPLPGMTCQASKSNFVVEAPTEDVSPVLIRMTGLSESDMNDLCLRDDPDGIKTEVHLSVHRGAKAQQTVKRYNLLCAAPFLKFAAANGLKYDLTPVASWNLAKPKEIPFGCCRKTVPERPTETWYFNEERGTWERNSEPGASRRYFIALQEAPQCFDFVVNRSENSLTVNCHPEVAAHHAAFSLIEGRGKGLERDVSVHFRLLAYQEDPVLERFRLHSCHDLNKTFVKLKQPYELYERQQKAVTKMLGIEERFVNFEEIEMNEQPMPGSTAWSLVAKASRSTNLRGGVIADAIGAGKTVISIAIILHGIVKARSNRSFPRKSSATLVVVPPGLIDQWKSEIKKFTDNMPNVICLYDTDTLKKVSVEKIVEADVVVCPVDILESHGYMSRLAAVATGTSREGEVPKLPTYSGQIEKNGANGVWIPASSQDPFGGANNPRNQQRRNEAAYFTHVYHKYIEQLRQKNFEKHERGIPLEYFEWERIFVDEIHECLCTSKDEMNEAKAKKDDNTGFFMEKNRRAGRELLGITTKDISKRPLVFRSAIFGLTATPLLDSTNRVIELANLMGNAYVVGLSNHWRNLEKESGRDIFLSNFLEPKQSREVRRNIYSKCQDYLDHSCCKNKNEEDMEGIELVKHREVVNMSLEEGELYKSSQSGINPSAQSFAIKVEDFDATAGHDVSKFLRQNAKLACRGKKLVEICKKILSEKGSENTKIIVFTDGRIGAGDYARDCLMAEDGLGCTWLDKEDSVQAKNKKLAWYQYGDVTEEDKRRPRVLVLHFEHAAGLNLQAECNNLILFTPLYIGDGGTTGDPVNDASTELQAIGRVFRPGQPKSKVNVYRIEVKGPNGQECLDGQLIRRNTDEGTIQMAVNADD